ncbi:hypothetical protein UFOVP855_38 [uncultured Caudovirales phage]|jgi:predicted DNA-binding transcriptional regulator|uniref:Helix-turn-helix domain containing protein n=1 Tax=uncultured Caudovirales phage TaxID=2100421 RepID=A0A6J5MXV3_9CAUD|nr:hypothetical protein UFOVP527_15 [uncultured Caudovirales phage]CAB4167665.1 hypothetical protein UFOVP855_38 [uncultured Caudovirales phage]CAB4173595.1 hypothetical protein UFOVP954_36 [uncultured Caudovirales phage]CAB4179048.1 hypothetical protein UFOVP1026_25 [uncultured Caudovirales phage]CAB4188303.1 hypothetical protein UFOVP1180_9 [uncultured Caudovirales phage]
MTIEKFSGSFNKEESGCTIVVNSTIQDIKDINCLAIYSYLVTKPPGWIINAKEVASHFSMSKDRLYKTINKLLELRLLKKESIRDKGRFVSFVYTLFLKPFPENKETVEPFPDSPVPVLPFPENKDAYKTKNIQNKEFIKKEKIYKKEKIDLPIIQPNEYQETYFLEQSSNNQNIVAVKSPSSLSSFENPHNIDIEAIEAWVEVRNKKKCPVTIRVWELLNNELQKCPNPKEAFDLMVLRGWTSVRAEWVRNESGSKQKSHFDYQDTTWATKKDIFD